MSDDLDPVDLVGTAVVWMLSVLANPATERHALPALLIAMSQVPDPSPGDVDDAVDALKAAGLLQRSQPGSRVWELVVPDAPRSRNQVYDFGMFGNFTL